MAAALTEEQIHQRVKDFKEEIGHISVETLRRLRECQHRREGEAVLEEYKFIKIGGKKW